VSDHYGTGGKLTTGEILRKITGGEAQEPAYRAVEHVSTPEGVEQTVRMVAIHAAVNNAAAPSRREEALAELTLIEARVFRIADAQGSVALTRVGEDLRTVRKMLETER